MGKPYIHIYKDEILEAYAEMDENISHVAKYMYHKHPELVDRCSEEGLRRTIGDALKRWLADHEVVAENVRFKKETQKYRDKNRIGDKVFREHARIENAVEELNKELIEILKKDSASFQTISHKPQKTSAKGFIHLSDTHFNELIDLPNNKYDFSIASKRLKAYANDVKLYCKALGIKECVLGFGGDLLNSDRRLDELLSMSTNRAKATQLSIRLLTYFINDLNKTINLHCVGVTGNESRAKQELGWSEILATDSYDFTIYDCLKIMYEDKKGIEFNPMKANEEVVCINGKNILLVHGHQIKGNVQKSVQEIIGKYAAKSMVIHYVMAGHIHSTYIADYFSRNASLAGSNAYSEEALNFVSRSAQNFHIFHEHDKIDSIKIDLQNIDAIEGYPIEFQVDAYNAKSASKNKTGNVILQIVTI